jgi:hypothetical protein
MVSRFLRQENAAYRDMQVVLTVLTLNFAIPSFAYFFAPDVAIGQFRALGRLLGGIDYPLAEESHLWRVLAAGNLFTLAFCCLLLQLNVKRFAPTVPVFVVLKGYTALGYLYTFLFRLPYRLFLGVFLFDALAVFLVVFLSRRALRAIEAAGPEAEKRLVPPLLG